jgi:hypothetical protein
LGKRLNILIWFLALIPPVLLISGLMLMASHPEAFDRGYFELIYPSALIVGLAYPIVGAIVARNQPGNILGWMMIAAGWMLAFSQGTIGYFIFSHFSLPEPIPGMDVVSWIGVWIWSFATSIIPLSLLYFPDGRVLSPVWNWVWVLILLSLLDPLSRAIYSWDLRGLELVVLEVRELIDQPDGTLGVMQTVGELAFILANLLAGISLVIRYRQSDMAGRLQIKWVAYGFSLYALAISVWVVLSESQSSPWSSPLDAFLQFLIATAALLTIVAIGIAILRYRLFDIDIIIRRTTSYAVITGFLILVYFGSVVIIQRIFGQLTGQDSTVSIVLSTLLIAALFLPVRRRVQDTIDRRFFRSKYDAEKTLEAFAATVRNETDLDSLTAELIRVIEETMQPESVNMILFDRKPDNQI